MLGYMNIYLCTQNMIGTNYVYIVHHLQESNMKYQPIIPKDSISDTGKCVRRHRWNT